MLSILYFFQQSWRPNGDVLGFGDDDQEWHSVEQRPDAVEAAGILVYRWEAPLFFANAGIFMEEIRSLVRQRHPRWVVVHCEAVTDIDVTAADMLQRLDLELNAQGVHVAFVELRDRLHELVVDYGLHKTLDRDHFYPTMEAALADIGLIDADRPPETDQG